VWKSNTKKETERRLPGHRISRKTSKSIPAPENRIRGEQRTGNEASENSDVVLSVSGWGGAQSGYGTDAPEDVGFERC
jgi:hypothetical protein